jgi:hypothetical protein
LLVCKVGENESVPKKVRENAEYDNYSCRNKRKSTGGAMISDKSDDVG